MTPEELEALRTERNTQLENLRIHDPILWCIIIQPRGEKALAEHLAWPIDKVRERLTELHKAKRISKKRFMSAWVYIPHPDDRELKRLARRAANIKFNNHKQLGKEKDNNGG